MWAQEHLPETLPRPCPRFPADHQSTRAPDLALAPNPTSFRVHRRVPAGAHAPPSRCAQSARIARSRAARWIASSPAGRGHVLRAQPEPAPVRIHDGVPRVDCRRASDPIASHAPPEPLPSTTNRCLPSTELAGQIADALDAGSATRIVDRRIFCKTVGRRPAHGRRRERGKQKTRIAATVTATGPPSPACDAPHRAGPDSADCHPEIDLRVNRPGRNFGRARGGQSEREGLLEREGLDRRPRAK